MDIKLRVDQDSGGGCIYPVLDPLTGKKSKLCGKEAMKTLDINGAKRAFCLDHFKEVVELRNRALEKAKRRVARGEKSKMWFKSRWK